jgi:Pathogenicity locus
MSRRFFMRSERRELKDLISIGPAMLRDFELLGIRSLRQLARQSPQALYNKLGRVAPQHMDACVLDTFAAAVAQPGIRGCPQNSAGGGGGAKSGRNEVRT